MPLTGKRVLVVDDHEILRRTLMRILKNAGVIVEGAVNGLQAVERVSAADVFDAVLMDYNMPEMNGLEAATRILTQFPTCIVLMSSDDISNWARRLGCAFMVKGRDLPMMLDILRNAMEKFQTPRNAGTVGVP